MTGWCVECHLPFCRLPPAEVQMQRSWLEAGYGYWLWFSSCINNQYRVECSRLPSREVSPLRRNKTRSTGIYCSHTGSEVAVFSHFLLGPSFQWTRLHSVFRTAIVQAEIGLELSLSLFHGQSGPPQLHGLRRIPGSWWQWSESLDKWPNRCYCSRVGVLLADVAPSGPFLVPLLQSSVDARG